MWTSRASGQKAMPYITRQIKSLQVLRDYCKLLSNFYDFIALETTYQLQQIGWVWYTRLISSPGQLQPQKYTYLYIYQFQIKFFKQFTVHKKTNLSSNTLYSRAQEQQPAQWSGIVLVAKFQSIIRAGNHIGSIYWASLQPFIKSNQKL